MHRYFNYIIYKLLLLAVVVCAPATLAVADEATDAKLAQMSRTFNKLLVSGSEDEFYKHAAEFEKLLLDNGLKSSYYKIKTNEGFFAVSHNHILQAIGIANQLQDEVKADGAQEYYYLPTGLLGDIYKQCHNSIKADSLYKQALAEVGDRDLRFTVVKYIELAEMKVLSDPETAARYARQAVEKCSQKDDVEYLAQALGMQGFVAFVSNDEPVFRQVDARYLSLMNRQDERFSHRFTKLMEMARAAFDKDYRKAEYVAQTQNLHVNRLFTQFRLYEMMGDHRRAYDAITRHLGELDSLFSVSQTGGIDEMAAQLEALKNKQQAEYNKKLADRVIKIFIGFTLLYLFVYIMGRRRLVRKIWAGNKQLKVALARAEESDNMKSAFIRNMSHQIRTPLNAISGFSQVLCSPDYELDDKEKADLEKRITENVEVITDIVSELLDLSKGENQIQKEPVMPNAVCRAVLADVEPHNKNGLQVHFESELPDDDVFNSNEDSLRRMLSHLLENALKFTEKGFVILVCRREGDNMEFVVTDTGIGIPKESSEKVFMTFEKLNEYTGGVGLGLSICRQLARQLGGDVVLDTSYRDGARFVLTLPTK